MAHRNVAFLKSIDQHGRLSLMRAYDGWPRSGFDRQATEIDVRRVPGDHGDEVQINITITKIKNDREYKSHGDMVLRGDDIALLIDHLQRNAVDFATKRVA